MEEDYLIRGYGAGNTSCRRNSYFTTLCPCKLGGFLSYQKTKFADQLFSFEFNTEKSDVSIAIAVKEASDSCAAAVYLT